MGIRAPDEEPAAIAAVLVATNCRGDIERNVAQLREQEGIDLEAVVVDNASSDGTREFLEQQPDLLLIANTENKWVSAARMQGVAATRAPYILFFAPDTSIPPDTVLRLKRCLDGDESVALAGPRMFGEHGHDMTNGQFAYPTVKFVVTDALGLRRRFGRERLPVAQTAEAVARFEETGPRDVPFVNGSCMLMRRSALEAIGGLDERFLFDFEEVDVARRLYKAGYRVQLVPKTAIMHRGKGTPLRKGLRAEIFMQSERLYFTKHHGKAARAAVQAARGLQRLLQRAAG